MLRLISGIVGVQGRWVLGMLEKVPLKSALKTSKSGVRISGNPR